RVLEIRLADAADGYERELAEARPGRLDVHVGRDARDLRDVLEPMLLELLCGDRGNGDRGRLQILGTESSGNDDFLQPGTGRRRRLGGRGSGIGLRSSRRGTRYRERNDGSGKQPKGRLPYTRPVHDPLSFLSDDRPSVGRVVSAQPASRRNASAASLSAAAARTREGAVSIR